MNMNKSFFISSIHSRIAALSQNKEKNKAIPFLK